MVDYYSILLRAVTAPGAGDERWRRNIYDRSRQMLSTRMRNLKPPAPLAAIATEEAALEAAIERVESELAWAEHGSVAPGDANEPFDEPDRGPLPSEPRLGGGMKIILALVAIAVLSAGGLIYWVQKVPPPKQTLAQPAPAAAKADTKADTKSAAPAAKPIPVSARDGDLAPGMDGGASDPDLPYVYRRQPTFYRTLQPVGTIIVDKLQRFLYLIQPNNVALRYGIAVGAQCADIAGMRHIASKAEWPAWNPPPEMLNRNPGTMPGGPGNPLGARILQLDDNASRINGTNAPKTIGNPVTFGCIRLDNDDVTDLYNRVKVTTPVLIN
jgi:lipoprotein-anchoring transpeptidase ErfK/SrfK